MSRPLNNIFDLELSPRLLVEASAGTGKTYTIVGIFVRLLVEKQLPPDQILVVTFTRMATRELKDRILARLRESLDALENGNATGDAFLTNLVEWCRNYPEAKHVLREAIRNFDEAQVHTIHGFCQKVLKEEALLTGAPFEVEVSQRDDLLQQAAEDFWRSFIHQNSSSDAGRYYISKVTGMADSPRKLLNLLNPLLNKHYAEIEAPEKIDVFSFLEKFVGVRRQMKEVWLEERDNILVELEGSHIKGLGKSTVEKRGVEIDNFLFDDGFSTDDFNNLKKTTSSYLQDDQNLTQKGNRKPQHQFFDLCEEYHSLLDDLHKVTSVFLQDAAETIRRKRDERAAATGFYSYEDLLNQLCKALRDPETGPVLAGRLQGRYPYALVDEFQDTDPVQYEIFDHIYSEEKTTGSLMMIGDPKQAIYAFRGADVYAYLEARDSVNPAGRYTLQRNFRSTKNLIQGINALFSGKESPFVDEDIEFFSSKAGRETSEPEYLVDGVEPVPFGIQIEYGIHNTSEAGELAFSETAKQVAELIAKGQRGEATIKGKSVTGGDIAILISSHKDAEDLKQRLHDLGVDAVTYSRENVFESPEASRMEMLMAAILDPADRKLVQNVLVSGFFGNNLNEIYNLQNDEGLRQDFVELLADLRDRWQKQGFYTAFRKVMTEQRAVKHFALFRNSERIITNLQQLAELCAFAERDHHMDGPSLLNWFHRRRVQSADEEEETLRLESDRDLVKISTIHNSKGLEFPVVFCPALWYAPQDSHSKKEIIGYHQAGGRRGLVLNLDQGDSESRKAAYNQHLLECVAEEVRKAYVALTRAKYECRIFWTAINATLYSGLGTLLIERQDLKKSIYKKYNLRQHPEMDDGFFIQALKSLAEHHPDMFRILENNKNETEVSLPEKSSGNKWGIRQWNRERVLLPERKINSFSSLVHHDPESVAEPDYDQWLEDYIHTTERSITDRVDIFSFPKGAASGTVIHKLFEHEHLDFRDSEKPGNEELIAEVLAEHGVDEKWIPVMHSMIGNVCGAVIGDLNLAETAPEDQLREMEFHLPVREPELDPVLDIIRNGAGANSLKTGGKSYLTGFVDLIVRQNGKYYILDYKSNHLGDSHDDYNDEALSQAVQAAGYDVQYHFYILALVKMLRQNLPDFSYEKHFGGAAYLFVRGMEKGSDNGVWFHKPDEKVILELDKMLERTPDLKQLQNDE